MKKNVKEPTILESPDVVAFISLHQYVNPRPFLKSHGRVVSIFDADVSGAVQAFYENAPVPITDYCSRLKLIRSMIFSMKGTGRQ